MNSVADQALDHVKYLSVQIQIRRIGPPVNLAAVDHINEVSTNGGLSVERQDIPRPNRFIEQTYLEINGDQLETSSNTFLPRVIITTGLVLREG